MAKGEVIAAGLGNLQEQIDELRDRIKILEMRTVKKFVKLGDN